VSSSSASTSTAALSNLSFTNVQARGSANNTTGGAVLVYNMALTMTDCTIDGAISDKYGGAIGGIGPSTCVLNGVYFTGCDAVLQGNILYGGKDIDISGITSGPDYIVGPGCKVEGIPITSLSMLLSPSMVYLPNGSITVAP
jgi:hypothetical protein